MTDPVAQQTAELLKAFDQLHRDIGNLNTSISAVGLFAIALLIVIAFRKRS